MNSLTIIRDLVYQGRFTESLSIINLGNFPEIGLSYIKNHSGVLIPSRRTRWLDSCWGIGGDYNKDYGYHSGLSFNTNYGDGYGYGWGHGYGFGNGYGWSYGSGHSCNHSRSRLYSYGDGFGYADGGAEFPNAWLRR